MKVWEKRSVGHGFHPYPWMTMGSWKDQAQLKGPGEKGTSHCPGRKGHQAAQPATPETARPMRDQGPATAAL